MILSISQRNDLQYITVFVTELPKMYFKEQEMVINWS